MDPPGPLCDFREISKEPVRGERRHDQVEAFSSFPPGLQAAWSWVGPDSSRGSLLSPCPMLTPSAENQK